MIHREKWVDDQGLPDGTTTEMGQHKTHRANERREKGERRDCRPMEREEMYETRRPSCLGRGDRRRDARREWRARIKGKMMNILRTAMDFFLRVEVVKNFGKEAELFLFFFDEVAVAAPLTGASTPGPGG